MAAVMTDKPGLNEVEWLDLVERIQKAMCIEPFRPDVTDVVVLIGTCQVLNRESERLRAAIAELQQDVERLQQQRAEQVLTSERLRTALTEVMQGARSLDYAIHVARVALGS